ncbi:MAG: S8 family serine peptidase, partial [Clostridia bacterium]|nr:S8 family serine peptidase [Clostridia bacterium]
NFQVATFSIRGPSFNRYKPDLIVSGVDVISTARFSEDDSFYTRMSGTSVSTPIVAGIVLKLLKHNNYSPDQIKYMLTNSTTPIVFDRNSEGWGVLNLDKLNLL